MEVDPVGNPHFIDFSQQDYFVNNEVNHGLDILGILAYAPRIYSLTPEADDYYLYPATSSEALDAWEIFVRKTVSHFKDRIHHWQIWPTCNTVWPLAPNMADNGAANYVALLQRAHMQIKNEDPTATVVTSSTDPTFLNAILNLGAENYFDAIGISAYSEPYAPEVSVLRDLTIKSFQDICNRRCPGKALWVTEYGWPTALDNFFSVDKVTHAAYTIRSFLLQDSLVGIDKVIQMDFHDQAIGGSYSPYDQLDNYGMLLEYGTDYPNLHKPAYDAYKSMTTALAGAAFRRAKLLPANSVELFENFEMPPTFLVATLNASGSNTISDETAHNGSFSMKINYSLDPDDTSSSLSIYPWPQDVYPAVTGSPTRITLWARSEGGPAPSIYVSFIDADHEVFSADFGLVIDSNWTKYTHYLDAPTGTSVLLNSVGCEAAYPHCVADGIVDYPIRFQAIGIKSWGFTSPVTTGTVFIDDITFEYGPSIFDLEYASEQNIIHALWTLSGSTDVTLPTSAPSATIRDWHNNTEDLPAVEGGITFNVNQHPLFVALPSAGSDTTGVFRPSNGLIYLKRENSTGYADAELVYGSPGDIPIAADWDGDGIDSIGIYRDGVFYLKNSNETGYADMVFAFGTDGDLPVVGDWDGDGVDTIGVYRHGLFMLRNTNDSGPAEMQFALGIPGDVPIAGNWDGSGGDSCGVFRPTNGLIYLKNENSTGYADIEIVFGIPYDKPIVGDWNGDGIDTIGVYREGAFLLRNSNETGYAEMVFGLGNDGDVPISGKWGLP